LQLRYKRCKKNQVFGKFSSPLGGRGLG